MAFEHYIYAGTRRLRCGYTTGSCAALAAQAAAAMLLGGERVERASIATPAGLPVEVEVLEPRLSHDCASCAVRKDGGDDADATDGLLIFARVTRREAPGVEILGGQGVGVVTRPGLEQPVGESAINSVPREMIRREVQGVCRGHGYSGGVRVTIHVPGGAAAAKRTFNPNLGVEGGISILGTTGIVEPRSLTALLESIKLELRQQAEQGRSQLILTPGNYGRAFLRRYPGTSTVPTVCCSNFLGEALDEAARCGFRQVLLVGHIGKLVKVAGGIMDTHSRMADCRTELFCAHGAAQGISSQTARQLLEAATADACVAILEQAGILRPVLQSLGEAMQRHLEHRADGRCEVGAVAFSNRYGPLLRTSGAEKLMESMGLAAE